MALEIGGRRIGTGEPVFVIAEIGLNHDGDLNRALELVDAAAWAGASAIKLQTIDADRLVAAACPPPPHVEAGSLRELFSRYELDGRAHRVILERARARGLAVLSTPFSEAAAVMLDRLGVDALKIASGDLTFDALIQTAGRTGRPLVLSTGMSTLNEVRRAVDVARAAGARDLVVLHCVSAYPTPPEAENLRAVATLAEALDVPVGLSDHGSGLLSAVAAAALGACVYERHLRLEHTPDVIDRAVSSTPSELRRVVDALAHTRRALGDGRKVCQAAEHPNVTPSRRGLYAARSLRAGERIARADVIALRPATGVSPASLPRLVGTVIQRDVAAGDPFRLSDLRASGAGARTAAPGPPGPVAVPHAHPRPRTAGVPS